MRSGALAGRFHLEVRLMTEPSLSSRLSTPEADETLRTLYARLPSTDFSREVLVRSPANLAVLRLNDIDWSDLGEPQRVMATRARIEAACSMTRAKERAQETVSTTP